MYSHILSKIKTTEEADKLNEEIDLLLNSFFEEREPGQTGFDYALKNKVRAWLSSILSEELSKEGVDTEFFLEELKKKLTTFKILKLDLAFEPTEAVIERMSLFARKNISEDVLLEINHLPNLIGGAVIIYEGEYRDFSLKKPVEEEFRKNREEIMELVGRELT
ncbi:unnamed protein product [marine sediment metagenome]|uniref:ATP synthase subunit delta n=1 Tax=marine sediment metagenome TaxID=412755 RepID=X0S461_9ZZZZ